MAKTVLGRGGSGAGRRAGPQLRKAGGRYTKKQVQTFLAEFAGSCNVTRACEVAGMSKPGAYQLRKRDPAFAKAWADALCEGYQRLEMLMLERALASASPDEEVVAEGRALQLSERSMMAMLSVHRQSVRDARATTSAPVETEGARAKLMAKLDEMHARLMAGEAAGPAQPAAGAAGAGERGGATEAGDGGE